MKHQTYDEVRLGLATPGDPLFGGSLAYLTVDCTLSLLLKLLKIKAAKEPERRGTFAKLDALIESVRQDAYEYIEKDGEVFAYISSHRNENIDEYVVAEARKTAATIENLQTISLYVAFLTTEIKGSLKNDFMLIKDNLTSARENLKGIFRYEASKIKDGESREAVEALLLSM